MLENYFLPQFTTQRKVTNKFHLFKKIKEDGYDIITGRDILKTMGLQIHYDTESFVWDDIKVKMVPRKHWDRASIKAFWQHRENAEDNHITEIKPAEYHVADLQSIVDDQKHLTSLEHKGITTAHQLNWNYCQDQNLFLVRLIQFQKQTST
jgi:hypothetical protein